MNMSKYRCINCQQSDWESFSTVWMCKACGHKYACVRGIPKLYVESDLGKADAALRDRFYNGLLGTYYQHLMPFLSLPARPAKANWKGWVIYLLAVLVLLASGALVITLIMASPSQLLSPLGIAAMAVLTLAAWFFVRHPYFFYLLVVAIPVKISLFRRQYRPAKAFPEIHAELVQHFLNRPERLQVLDISTGTCNSLYRHGWMKLNADYTGLDLSETMLLQGLDFMAQKQVPMDFVLGDANRLPFSDDSFDIVLNYGALNGYADAGAALSEMARVTKSRGLMLVLDEQLYDSPSAVEKIYYKRVLSSHNLIHRCPVELIPPNMEQVTVHQVYQFYYLCTAFKR